MKRRPIQTGYAGVVRWREWRADEAVARLGGLEEGTSEAALALAPESLALALA